MERNATPELDRSTFGQMLRTQRAKLGMSLAQLASRLHFDKGHVSKIETDKRLPSVTFAKACDRVLESGDTFTTIAEALKAAGQQRVWIRPAQLLAGHRNFVGRRRYFDRLDSVLVAGERSLGLPVAVVDGPPGVGKTALAVQWAQRAVEQGHFPDGQIYVELRGRAAVPADPAAVLADLLGALGVPAAQVPAEEEQRGAVLRSLLHDRDVLLVLDDAADARQVLPLLPGSRGCAVVITSRVRLPGLSSRVGAVTLTLPELSSPEAIRLVRSIIGEHRTDADPAAVTALAELCGHLPIALVRAAERIVHLRHRSAAALAATLADPPARLDLAEGGGTIRAALASSYALLDDASARVFRLLGGHADALVTAEEAAAFAGVGADDAARLLRRIAGVHLVRHREEHVFAVNALIRVYAGELLAAHGAAARQNGN